MFDVFKIEPFEVHSKLKRDIDGPMNNFQCALCSVILRCGLNVSWGMVEHNVQAKCVG